MARLGAFATLAMVLIETAAGVARADTYPIVVLRALDKVTARATTIYAPIDQAVYFRTLQIVPRVCDKTPPEERPEAAAFVEITELREGRPPENVFRGWMFESSPGLSPMQHPVYDVWVLDCVSAADKAPASATGSGSE